jgi:hypothetical protein
MPPQSKTRVRKNTPLPDLDRPTDDWDEGRELILCSYSLAAPKKLL